MKLEWRCVSRCISGIAVVAVAIFLGGVNVAAQGGGITTRVSVASDGTPGNAVSGDPSISADGRYVAFASEASNLVPGDTNSCGTWIEGHCLDVFVHDRQTGTTTRVSVASNRVQGNDQSGRPSISADGRYVAFDSLATNLVVGDSNDVADVFLHDRQTGQTTLGAVNYNGGPLAFPWGADMASISGNGRYVGFRSGGCDVVAGYCDYYHSDQIYIRDRQAGQTTPVSVAYGGGPDHVGSLWPSLSGDGRYVAFVSWGTNLVPGGTSNQSHVYVRDLHMTSTLLVSVTPSGTEGNGISDRPAISASGRFVAFESYASNLVFGDTNSCWSGTQGHCPDVFVHDRQTRHTERVSVASGGAQANGPSHEPAISADGRYVTFWSEASNLVPDDTNGEADIFLHDRQTGQTERVSVKSDGTQGNQFSYGPSSISADGRYVAFESWATNLVPGGTGKCHIYVRDRAATKNVYLPAILR
jgi:Tol biopolymer transport system component